MSDNEIISAYTIKGLYFFDILHKILELDSILIRVRVSFSPLLTHFIQVFFKHDRSGPNDTGMLSQLGWLKHDFIMEAG